MRAAFAGLLFTLVATACADGGSPSTPAPLAPSPTPVSSAPVAAATATGPLTPVDARVPAPEPLSKMTVEEAFPNLSYSGTVHLTYPEDGTNRLFLVLQPGRIMMFDNHREVGSAKTFLDIRDRVNDSATEEGLLGLAFDPQYKTSGYFYVYYSATSPRRSVISRFSVNVEDPIRADPTSEQIILEVPSPSTTTTAAICSLARTGSCTWALATEAAAATRGGTGRTLPRSWLPSCAST